jgi:putative zinc finger protein
MNACGMMRVKFSEYLDGRLTGLEMQRVAAHLQDCRGCAGEWFALRQAQASLARLGPVPEPRDLLLRIRVAVSQERARRNRSIFHNWRLAWQNTIGPFLLQAAAGFASAVLLLGSVVVLVGLVAQPQAAHAGDEPLGNATAPRLLYSLDGCGDNDIASLPGPIVVEAYVNRAGQVYDFRIVSGPSDPVTRSQVENLLLQSVFAPASFFGQPVRGLAIVSFSGISVRG